MNLDDKFKKMKELMDAGAIKFPTFTEIPKYTVKLLGLGDHVQRNINQFDSGTRDGYKLNLLTGKFYKP